MAVTAPRRNVPRGRGRLRDRTSASPSGRDRLLSSCWFPAFGSAFLLWLSLPPVDAWPLAFVAPLGWLWLCRRETLPGRRPWLTIWLSGFAFWMAVLHWLRLPHPATSLGWFAVSFYFAFYTPVFVWLTRAAVHGWRLPLVLAAPLVWTGLELLRGHLLTGFTYASLGHTQYRWLSLIQLADFAGAYGVSFVVMLVAAGVAQSLPGRDRRFKIWPVAVAGLVMLAALAYGQWRLAQRESLRPGPKVALIQGSIDTQVKADPTLRYLIHDQYMDLSRRAVREHSDLAFLVWPETMFREPLLTLAPDFQAPVDADWTEDDARSAARYNEQFMSDTVRELGVPAILGVDRHRFGRGTMNHFNTAVHVAKDGRILERYDKVHCVMFGEYIPFGEWIPWVYSITPLAAALTSGTGPECFQIGPYRVAPNICFENILPHFIGNQVRVLRSRGQEPDLLVNLTNDGWFWGSSELDLHLTCAVFRAVENRKPFLIAANTGFSAAIDSQGRILKQGPRRDTAVVASRVMLDSRKSPYSRWGDLFAGGCLVLCATLATRLIVPRLFRLRGMAKGPDAAKDRQPC